MAVKKQCFAILCSSLSLLCCAEEYCCGPQRMIASARYTTPQGIGYTQSYATVDGFFAPKNFLKKSWFPFLDIRGHVFNNGQGAANAGVGVRYLAWSRLWGVNAYYDFRTASNANYNQLGAGFETLGKVWDFRINGYFPVKEKQSQPFNTSSSFQGNYLMIQYSQSFALTGVNAEVGAHVDHCKNAPFYFAAGPYYLSDAGNTAWGGEFRARVDLLYRYFRIEANVSYDHLYKWIGQAQFSVNVPFGGKSKGSKDKGLCSQTEPLLERTMQPVDRFEIIAEFTENLSTPAINPATGQPWVF